jgi:hypothetical protein
MFLRVLGAMVVADALDRRARRQGSVGMTAARGHAMSAPVAEHHGRRSQWVGGIADCAHGIDTRRSASSSATARIERVS